MTIIKVIIHFKLSKVLLSLFILTLIVFEIDQHSAIALSIKEEAEMGDQFYAAMRYQFDLVEDDFAKQYMLDLCKYLTGPIETRPFPLNFYIAKDNNLNAFAGPGGHIFIYSGLISAMDVVDEMAAVLCHEIAHVIARHLSERIEQSKKVGLATMAGVLAGALVGGEAASAIVTGSVAAGAQVQLKYSREDERQADQLSNVYMNMAGFDPSGMVGALVKLQQGNWVGTESTPPYLLTHPGGAERISNIESMLRSQPFEEENPKTDAFRKRFDIFKTVVKAKSLNPVEAERIFRLELEKDPDSGLAHFGTAIALKGRAEYDKAVSHFLKSLKELPGNIPISRCLAETYQYMGKDSMAIEILEGILKEDPHDKASLYLAAVSYQNMEEYGKSDRVYERLIHMNPVRDEVFYNLGIVYGKQDKLGLAHYNFGIYFKRLNQREKSEFHFKKAEELSKNNPDLMKRIQKELANLSQKKS